MESERITVDKKKVAFICVHNSCRSQMAEAAGPQLVQLDATPVAEDMLQIQYRGAELKLPAGVDMDAVATLLRSLQSL